MNLRTRFMFFFGVVLVLLAVVGLATNIYAVNALESAYTSNAQTLAAEKMYDISDLMTSRIHDVEDESQAPLIITAVTSSNDAFDEMENADEFISKQDELWQENTSSQFIEKHMNSSTADALRHWAELSGRQPLFAEVIVTNRYGAIVATTGKTTDYRQDDEEWWQNSWNGGTQLEAVIFDESSGTYGFDIATTVNNENGTRIGVIKAVYSLEEMKKTTDRLDKSTDLPTSIKLVSDTGQLIYDSKSESAGDLLKDVSDAAWYKRIDGREGSFRQETPDGERLVVYRHNSGGTHNRLQGWQLIIEYPTDVIFKPVTDFVYLSAIFAIIITLAIIFTSLYLNREIYRPIYSLTEVMESISRGELTASIDKELLDRNDEIGRLARSFNRLLTSLKLAMRRSSGE